MVGFGLLIGVAFPFFLLVMGVPEDIALRGDFMALCLAAGALVGGVNVVLAGGIVRPRLRETAHRMQQVEAGLDQAVRTGDWSRCDPDSCRIEVDSDDELGELALAFNRMLLALHRSHQVETALGAFGREMATHLEVQALAQASLELYRAHDGADAGAIFSEHAGELELAAHFGLEAPESLAERDLVREALRTGRPLRFELPEGCRIDAGLVQFAPAEVVSLPLSFGELASGVVVLARRRAAEPYEQVLGRLFSRQLGVALHNAVTHQQLQRIAALDAMTGAYNRRFGMRRLREELLRAMRADQPLGLVLFDVDHFKRVNDGHGHLVGDRVLIAVARAARKALREGDVLVRYGGEEFFAVLPGAGLEDATRIAERIRFAAAECEVEDGPTRVRVTLSAGVACWPVVPAGDELELVQRADEALYTAKRAGRDRAVSAQPRPSSLDAVG